MTESATESVAAAVFTHAICASPQPKRPTASGWKVAITPALTLTSSSPATKQKPRSSRRL